MSGKRFELKLNINSIGLPEGKILTDNLTGEKGFSLEEFLSIANNLNNENKELKSLCKVLITHIEKKSIAFVIDKEVRRLLE